MLIISTTASAEEPPPIRPTYCRLGGFLWEHHGEGRTKLKGKKKVKKKELSRIACENCDGQGDSGVRHIDGRLLLDKNGQPTTCSGASSIFTTAGTHTLGIGDKDFTIEFEPVTWYAFDCHTYTWTPPGESAPTTDPMFGLLLQPTSIPAPVFGQGKWAEKVKKIILVRYPKEKGWGWYHGPEVK